VKETQYGALEINQLLNTLREYDNAIGSYEQHLLTDDRIYSIKLSNGTIRIYPEELGKQVMPRERLLDMVARFRER
jgi:hypothetical protein